ncbi:PF11827 family protein [Leptospira weilii serovar Topaz str. LT2116]|uniref:PF11827 family protein n=1 Tax=Leptospira weilii serovar Topaz str. LT2116 TaxID=1088540 RepID=M3G0W2_9LEPT|nr:PF11827 family protein [Leptospira weilii serovar Topaz str. LT2116]
MQKILILLISTLIFLSFCKKTPPVITESEKDILQQILVENESIHSFLMKEEGKIPDTSKLISHIKELISLNGGLKSSAERMENFLQNKDTKDIEKFFQAYSSFSENLADSLKLAGGAGVFNRFYCPMVNKTWVSHGTKIQNPYSPEMRDCGDLVR